MRDLLNNRSWWLKCCATADRDNEQLESPRARRRAGSAPTVEKKPEFRLCSLLLPCLPRLLSRLLLFLLLLGRCLLCCDDPGRLLARDELEEGRSDASRALGLV